MYLLTQATTPYPEDTFLLPLSQGKFATVDIIKSLPVSRLKWYAKWNKCTRSFYAATNMRIGGKRVTIMLHRFLLDLCRGDKRIGDHINRNTLDYRMSNLRIATTSQNAMNRRLRSDNVTGLKGVHKANRGGGWISSIGLNGAIKRLGTYRTAMEAHIAYCEAAKILHGEFHSPN